MLTRVEVRTRQGTLLNLPLEDVDSGYVIEEIEGLDPVNATLVSSGFAGQDGEQYHSSRREKRNLKFKIKFEPDYVDNTVRSLRQNLYRFLMPKSEASLRFYDSDGSYVDIVGRVESNQAPIFTSEPGADVSLVCFNPDFIDPNPITQSATSTPDVMTFTTVTYRGTVEAGVLFTVRPNRAISSFTIYHTSPSNQTRSLDFTADLLAGDVVRISTVPGGKGATLTRANYISSLLYAISPQSYWLSLEQGDNRFRLALSGAAIPYEIQYITRHGGL